MTWMVYGSCIGTAFLGLWLVTAGGEYLFNGLKQRFFCSGEGMKYFFRAGWKETVFGKRLLWLLQEQKRLRGEWEIGEALAYLRNTVAMGRGESMSAGLILEELSELQGTLSSAYLKMLHYLRLNEKEKAMNAFYLACGSEMSRDFARLLLQWEELPPTMLVETLESYQKNIREVRLTKQKKKDEIISDFIYLPVIINVMLVLINFIYVAYFIDQREMLLTMFG